MLKEIFNYIQELDFDFEYSGKDGMQVSGISMIKYAKGGDICYLDANVPALYQDLSDVILICPLDFEELNPNIGYIKVEDPKLVFYYVSRLFHSNRKFELDLEKQREFPGVIIEKGCSIGENVQIHPGVTLRSNTVIEDGVTIESGCVIGSTGLLWTLDKRNNEKVMLQLTGGVRVAKNAYLCANISVVRGACGEMTHIGEGVMIAPGTAVGHGCVVKANTHIANNVTLSGAVVVEEDCFLGSGCAIQPAVVLKRGSVVGSSALVTKSHDTNGVFAGIPAKKIKEVQSGLKGLPRS